MFKKVGEEMMKKMQLLFSFVIFVPPLNVIILHNFYLLRTYIQASKSGLNNHLCIFIHLRLFDKILNFFLLDLVSVWDRHKLRIGKFFVRLLINI